MQSTIDSLALAVSGFAALLLVDRIYRLEPASDSGYDFVWNGGLGEGFGFVIALSNEGVDDGAVDVLLEVTLG